MYQLGFSHCHDVDIAIVGAGAAGAYAAWKLSEVYPDRSMHIYEANNRVGGRLYSLPIPGIDDFVADLGGMRFNALFQELTFQAIDDLGLELINFTTPQVGVTTLLGEKLYYLRGQYLLQEQINNGQVPYYLTETERNVSGRIDKMIVMWNKEFIEPGENDIYERKTLDGKSVFKLGAYNEWQKYGSREALSYITDMYGMGYWLYGNLNLAHQSETEIEENPKPWPPFLTLKAGTDALPKAMIEDFLVANGDGNRLYLNHELVAVDTSTSNITITLRQNETQELRTVHTGQLILAMGETSLQQVQWSGLDHNSTNSKWFDATVVTPAVKIFLAYDQPWWREGGNGWAFDQIAANGEMLRMITTDLPLRMIQEIGEDSSSGNSLLLVYNEGEIHLNFWKHHMENGQRDPTALDCEFTPSVELVNLTQTYLAKIFNLSLSDIPSPYASVAHAWYKKPYYGSWHKWSPGNKHYDVQEEVLKPFADREVYVIGEAYTEPHLQSWVEGAYERAEAMLENYFN